MTVRPQYLDLWKLGFEVSEKDIFEGVNGGRLGSVGADEVVVLTRIGGEVVHLRLALVLDRPDVVRPLRLVQSRVELDVLAVPEVRRANRVPHRLRVSRRRTSSTLLE